MAHFEKLGNFIEDLWTKGFKLSDRDVHFIYFGKNYANAEEWLVIFAVRATIQLQFKFDESFYIAVLEYLSQNKPTTLREAWKLLEKRGLSKQKDPRTWE
ncbi:hypothetical protein GLW08_00060 [Pontibacillus yanchengensis]|uniref:Uncharacterized protein n=2 Tax=Pontibacillus yanchengensis TaxID=462910 RepID=A0ACC7VAP7_9BACI|nr:DUF6123 family protein [Pontibacillus yanchengensis]MYL32811.1 hypothetical protein [Pontibacillus yanchengensis]MYL51722.1 hypothetical protein [Pontibacillus yanchengensis]